MPTNFIRTMLLITTFSRATPRLLAVLSFVLLTACGGGSGGDGGDSGGGGGGGGNDPSYAVTFSPNPLTARWNDLVTSVEPVTVTVTFSPVPTGLVYPGLVADTANFENRGLGLRQISDSSWEFELYPLAALPVGIHNGSLMPKLCKDTQCAAEYALTGGNLPYEFTVVAGLAVKVRLNGAAVSDGAGGQLTAYANDALTLDIASGDVVELTSAAEVDWVTDTHGQTANTIEVLDSSPTRWRGRISGPRNRTGLGVLAIPRDTTQRSAQIDFFIQ